VKAGAVNEERNIKVDLLAFIKFPVTVRECYRFKMTRKYPQVSAKKVTAYANY